MNRKEKLNEIVNLLDEHINLSLITITPRELDNVSKIHTSLSEDNNYQDLKFVNVFMLVEIEKLLEDNIISNEEADMLELKYFEYLSLINKKSSILYNNFINGNKEIIPESLINNINEMVELFIYYGLDIQNNTNIENDIKRKLIK